MAGTLAEVPSFGPAQGYELIGEVTEAMHKWLLDGYDLSDQPPRFEEELKFVPKDREEVIYVYMYRVARNPNLVNQKRWRQAPIYLGAPEDKAEVFYHRPPLMLDLFYLVSVHSKFRSDAERLMGWVMLRLHEATHLVYRPRKFKLPDGREVDSLGRSWDPNASTDDDNLVMEKVSLDLVDDLTVGDVINFLNLHEAPYRPFLTYRARIAMDGPLVASSGGSGISMSGLGRVSPPDNRSNAESPAGRIMRGKAPPKLTPPGPPPHNMKRQYDDSTDDSE